MSSAHLIRCRFQRLRGSSLGKRERGSFAVTAAAWMLVAIAALGAIDIGNVYFVRRDLQRIADMSALAAVQTMDDQCSQPPLTAAANAAANGFSTSTSGNTIQVACGRWDINDNSGPSYFGPATSQLNAVQVTVTESVPYFFFGLFDPARANQVVQAVSTAKAANIDAFSVGATLASLGGTDCSGTSTGSAGLVNELLSALLLKPVNGTQPELGLNIASYQGLACTNVKLGDLAQAAVSAGTVNGLMGAKISLSSLLTAMATAASTSNAASINLTAATNALTTIANAQLSNVNIDLASVAGSGTQSLLQFGLGNPQAAADAQVNLLDMLMVAAEIAQANQPAVTVSLSVPNSGPLPLGSLAGSQLQVQIISPPTLAVGEGGKDASGWRTQASTASIGIYLVVNLGTQNLPIVGSIISAVVKLPVYLQVATGQAWLNSTDCMPTAEASTAVITAQPGIANLCIGQPPLNSSGQMSLSSTYSCASPGQVLNTTLLSGAVSLAATVSNVSTQVQGAQQTNTFSGVSGLPSDYWTTDSNALGSELSSALAQLSNAQITPTVSVLFGLISITLPPSFTSTLLNVLTSALTPLLSSLDTAIVPLLQLLGVQVGAATVHQMSLTCGVAQTVYNALP